MSQSKITSLNKNQLQTLAVFFILSVYWIYLLFTSKMEIVFDAAEYFRLAQIIHDQGWREYFIQGPTNEPFYPFVIHLSMTISSILSVNVFKIQTAIQILWLFITVVLTYKTMGKLNVSSNIKNLCALYIGISPAMVNSSLSLWSEILAYPFVLLIVLTCAETMEMLKNAPLSKIIWQSVKLGVLFIIICLLKAIFEYIFYIFIVAMLILFFINSKAINQTFKKNAAIFLLASSLIFIVFAVSFKSINQKLNGHFVLAGRGSYILYGNTMKRTQPMTERKYLAMLSSLPGEGICRSFFSTEECDYWTMRSQDLFGYSKWVELKEKGVPGGEIEKTLMTGSKQMILEKPAQYFILTVLETIKMFFWESTKIGFVQYPRWLDVLFNNSLFKNGLRFLMFVLTMMSFIFTANFLFKKRFKISFNGESFRESFLSISLVLVVSYTALYSLSTIHTRYALPLAPFFIIFLALALDKILPKYLRLK